MAADVGIAAQIDDHRSPGGGRIHQAVDDKDNPLFGIEGLETGEVRGRRIALGPQHPLEFGNIGGGFRQQDSQRDGEIGGFARRLLPEQMSRAM